MSTSKKSPALKLTEVGLDQELSRRKDLTFVGSLVVVICVG
jgi:hypothetical protein